MSYSTRSAFIASIRNDLHEINARLDTSPHGPPPSVKDAGWLREVWQAPSLRRWCACSLSTGAAGTWVTVLWHVLAVLFMADGLVQEDPLHGLHARQTPNPLDFYLREYLKSLAYAAPADNERHFTVAMSDYLQVPRHLWTDAAVHEETCRGVHWISLRSFWALILILTFQL
jgi:hypothetical protein